MLCGISDGRVFGFVNSYAANVPNTSMSSEIFVNGVYSVGIVNVKPSIVVAVVALVSVSGVAWLSVTVSSLHATNAIVLSSARTIAIFFMFCWLLWRLCLLLFSSCEYECRYA